MSADIIEYDKNGNKIEIEYYCGCKQIRKYDKDDRLIHIKYYTGKEKFFKYDKNGNRIDVTEEVEFLNRDKVSRFELMDI